MCFLRAMLHHKDSAWKSLHHDKTVMFLIMYRTSCTPGKCEPQTEVSEDLRGLCSLKVGILETDS